MAQDLLSSLPWGASSTRALTEASVSRLSPRIETADALLAWMSVCDCRSDPFSRRCRLDDVVQFENRGGVVGASFPAVFVEQPSELGFPLIPTLYRFETA